METIVNDINTERALLASMINSPAIFTDLGGLIDGSCFYDNGCRRIFTAIADINSKGGTADIVSLYSWFSSKGEHNAVTLSEITTGTTARDYRSAALRLKELSMRRRLWKLGTALRQAGTSEATELDVVQSRTIEEIESIFRDNTDSLLTLTDTYGELRSALLDRMNGTASMRASATGFNDIDNHGGLMSGELIIIAGESSQGKTAFATTLALRAISQGHPVAFYSMEMSARQMTVRIAAQESGVKAAAINYGTPTAQMIEKLDEGMGTVKTGICFFDERSTSSLDDIIASIRVMHLKQGIRGAVVDYLQILNVNTKTVNKEQSLADAARRLKNLAKELDIWIIALSQLNRDRDNPQPTIARLRDSGQIAEAADTVMLVYRPEVYGKTFPKPYEHTPTTGMAMIDVAKGRNTGIYKFICAFDSGTVTFRPLDENEARMAVADERQPIQIMDNLPF